MKLVNAFLEESAAKTPEKTALVCGEQRLTYAQIEAMANRLAQALVANGVGRGDRILLFLPNSVEMVVGIFATLKANAVFVPVNHSTKADKLHFMAQDCRAAGLITWQQQVKTAVTLQQSIPSLKTVVIVGDNVPDGCHNFAEIQETFLAERPCCQTIDQDLACLIYTSGSTGEPKGVMSAHSNVVFAASSIIHYLQNQPDDIVLNVLPLSFDYGLYQLLMTFKFGGTLVLERSFAYPAQIFKRIVAEKVTGFPLVPTIAAILLQLDLSSYDFSSLRYLTNTAAALSPSHITALQEKFPQATLYSMYGLTETKRTLYLPPEQLAIRPGSVGIPIPGTEAWVEDEAGNRLGPDEIGELVIRGSHVMRGYWERPEATAERFRLGAVLGERLCYSGDLFRVDSEGFFYFVGRKDDIIKSRGEKVAPKEIENVLSGLSGVVETAVIGVPDPVLGEAIKAFVVQNDDTLTERDVLRHCRQHLEDFMVPQHIEFRSTLPKSGNGKIAKKELQ
ncbi:class I adenylate-forming enzyme family protein [Candidatus Leptofilum sp.]|uniref:class I adenylate-forming enzyme family protein n=1 Tax=Candidatus Leptofilum sp. TaxID=3241576 RepID=UPI003B58B6EE